MISATAMWYDDLPGEKAWSGLWYDYAICGRCRGIRASGACPICGDPPFDMKPMTVRDERGEEYVVHQPQMGAEGR